MAAMGTFASIASVVLGRTLSDAILLSARPALNVANFFIFSSLALMAVSLVYFQLLRIVSATKLHIAILLISALGAMLFQHADTSSHLTVLSYAIFLITAPALGNIIIWNAIGDAFDARQGRRLFHMVCAASTLGGIAAGCVIPTLIREFGIPALPIANATAFTLMCLPVIVLRKKRRQERTAFSVSGEGKRTLRSDFVSAFRDIVNSPLLKNLSLIFFLTALTTNIIDFVLKYYLQTNFDKEGIAIFYGHFNAVSNTFNLLVQLTLLSQFLTRFKTRTLFAMTPVVLLFFTLPFLFVYSAVAVVALRFMDVALRFTVQDAAREIAISSLPRLLRNRSKVVFKGVMNPMGGITAGLLLNALAPFINPQFAPLILIPVIGITLYFVRDLNRYSADHLFKQLRLGTTNTSGAGLNPASVGTGESPGPISYNPEMLMDDSPIVREATLDAILITRDFDLQTHSDIHRFANALVAREVRLAQATLTLIQFVHENEPSTQDDAPSKNTILDTLQDAYDKSVFRLFKALMTLYQKDMIQTIFQSLSAERTSTRVQAIELLQLTLTNTPYAKRILVLCDDFQLSEKVIRLDDIEHMSPEDAIIILESEQDRKISKIPSQIAKLFPTFVALQHTMLSMPSRSS